MLLGFILAIALAGPTQHPAFAAGQQPVPAHPRTAAPKTTPQLTDAQLESLIRAKFAKSKIDADKFTVRVRSGIATIEGHTDVIQHKGVATRMARSAGAIAVNNQVRIGDAARQKAAGNLEQGRKRVEVQRGDAKPPTTPPGSPR